MPFAPAPVLATPAGLASLQALAAYDDTTRALLVALKNGGARHLVHELACRLASRPWPGSVTAVTWAPTTPSRRRERGYDHAELLARAVGRQVGVPVRRLLVRHAGRAQAGRDKRARADPAGFRAVRRSPAGVLLVDDVATTGATLAAAAAALRGAGAVEVHGLVVARAR